MRIGVICEASSTGAWRYLYCLVGAMNEIGGGHDITLYYRDSKECPFDLELFAREKAIELYRIPHKRVARAKRESVFRLPLSGFRLLKSSLRMAQNRQAKRRLLVKLHDQDLLFYPWPYNMEPYKIAKPLVFVPHDFIFSHYFGHHVGNFYSRERFEENLAQIGAFSEMGSAIVSSNYVAGEYKRLFPGKSQEVNVIPLGSLSGNAKPSAERCREILRKHGIDEDYILLPTNSMHHKNIGQVLGAYYYIKQEASVKLVIFGYGTEGVRVTCNSPYYCDHVSEEEPCDIKSLGFVPDEEAVALISMARVVVNASLCEAGCGSGLDAWGLGVPTAISDIPPYVEQVRTLGVKTAFFDPRNSRDIARAVLSVLKDEASTKNDVWISKEKVDGYTWDIVARQYMDVFLKTREAFNGLLEKRD